MSGCSDEDDVPDGYRDGGSDGDDDDSEIGKSEVRRRRRTGFGKSMGKAVLQQYTKAKTTLRRVRSRKGLVPKSRWGNEGNVIVEGDSGGRGRGSGSGSWCRFCLSRPKVLESPDESPTSDPNNPNFTRLMLKNLIENNDFYCKDCNPHLD
ncbi:uncharacterized protein LOC109797273 [Cajanus cajan]|uniref:uncharacterized protein LOC109797273 n=1 Tax=Cajanus cajan TaxID=3821 RepID=UPI00098DCE3C|nr:uncharacterized protein LOC109797273 [Cajanus cajan]